MNKNGNTTLLNLCNVSKYFKREVYKQYKPSPRNKKNLKQLKLPPKIIRKRRTKNKKPHKDSRRKKLQRGDVET